MTPKAKSALSAAMRRLRGSLLDGLHAAPEGTYRLSIKDLAEASLTDELTVKCHRLERWIDEQVRASGDQSSAPRFRVEIEKRAAYTLSNRLVLLRLLEGTGLRKVKVLTGGWSSPAYRETFRPLAGALTSDDTEGYRFLRCSPSATWWTVSSRTASARLGWRCAKNTTGTPSVNYGARSLPPSPPGAAGARRRRRGRHPMNPSYPKRHHIIANLVDTLTGSDFLVLCSRNHLQVFETAKSAVAVPSFATNKRDRLAAMPRPTLGDLVASIWLQSTSDGVSVSLLSKSDLVSGIVHGVCAPRGVIEER